MPPAPAPYGNPAAGAKGTRSGGACGAAGHPRGGGIRDATPQRLGGGNVAGRHPFGPLIRVGLSGGTQEEAQPVEIVLAPLGRVPATLHAERDPVHTVLRRQRREVLESRL